LRLLSAKFVSSLVLLRQHLLAVRSSTIECTCSPPPPNLELIFALSLADTQAHKW
jgi:hypothetical protein